MKTNEKNFPKIRESKLKSLVKSNNEDNFEDSEKMNEFSRNEKNTLNLNKVKFKEHFDKKEFDYEIDTSSEERENKKYKMPSSKDFNFDVQIPLWNKQSNNMPFTNPIIKNNFTNHHDDYDRYEQYGYDRNQNQYTNSIDPRMFNNELREFSRENFKPKEFEK